MAKPLLALVLAVSFLTAGAPTAAHAQRLVVVNGRIMTPQALAALDRAACLQVPNGAYWLDTEYGRLGLRRQPSPARAHLGRLPSNAAPEPLGARHAL